MGLEEIKTDILEEAEKKSDEIVKEAKQEKKEIINEAEEEAEEIKQEMEEELEEEEEAYRQKELSNARMKAKQEKMKAKQEKLEDVFDEFEDHLRNLSDEEKQKFAESCLARVEFDVAKVKGSEEFEDAVDTEFEEADINGIIVVSEDGNRKQEFTFDKILKQYKEKYRKEVADILF